MSAIYLSASSFRYPNKHASMHGLVRSERLQKTLLQILQLANLKVNSNTRGQSQNVEFDNNAMMMGTQRYFSPIAQLWEHAFPDMRKLGSILRFTLLSMIMNSYELSSYEYERLYSI